MSKATVIPFGPQHPVLPEPLHLDLVVQDETVVDVLPQIGFVHRGLEKLVETRDYNQFIYIAERICGICAMGHSLGYAETVESLMGVEVPKRAEYLRVIWHELSRIHSHLLWLGLAADEMCIRDRECGQPGIGRAGIRERGRLRGGFRSAAREGARSHDSGGGETSELEQIATSNFHGDPPKIHAASSNRAPFALGRQNRLLRFCRPPSAADGSDHGPGSKTAHRVDR